jgi:hypothetical protein
MIQDTEDAFSPGMLNSVVQGRSQKHAEHGGGKNHIGGDGFSPLSGDSQETIAPEYQKDQPRHSQKRPESVEDSIGDFFTRGLEGQGQNGGFIYRLFHGGLDTDYGEWLQIDSLPWYRISL